MSDAMPLLILAAGRSSRMAGRDKLMEEVEGRPLIRRQAEIALEAGLAPVVALPAADHPRAAALAGLPLRTLVLPGAQEGMGGTLREGVAALPPCPRFMVMAADLPGLTAADLARMAGAEPGDALVVIATDAAGQFGHPVIFDATLRPAFAGLSGDDGARAVVRSQRGRIMTVPLPGDHATRDLDTPADWAAWRAGR